MSDARSLTPLSQADFEAIEAAVLETARGRWFMAEYAKRNRQADTQQLLTAIGRIERVVGLGVQETSRESNILEAAALIGDLRADLERMSGRADDRSSGLAARIEVAAGVIVAATEAMQEVAWTLREAGAEEALCDTLDRRSAEISGAVGAIDGVVQRIDKISDTIAMLDSSLRAFGEASYAPTTNFFEFEDLPARKPSPASALHDLPSADFAQPTIDRVEAQEAPTRIDDLAPAERRITTVAFLDDDLVFAEPGMPVAAQAGAMTGRSEAGLRDLDAMPADRKLAYFA